MNFLEQKQDEIVTNLAGYFRDRLKTDSPHDLLEQVEKELQAMYVRYGNDWTGRGVVGDSALEANIAALEAARVECLACLREGGEE